jgi:hypothetical protein
VRLNLEPLEDRMLPSSYTAATVLDLIADINAANAAGGSNTITLTAPTASPYVLAAVDNSTDGPTGLPVIANNDTLTISGKADTIERSTASGTPDFRLFDVASGASLTLQGLTLTNGSANAATSGRFDDYGGAVLNWGILTTKGCTISANQAYWGGGITNFGNATVSHTTLSHNNATYSGGGIWNNSSLTLDACTVESNFALISYGGGISQQYGTLTIIGSDVVRNSDNTVDSDDIYFVGGQLVVTKNSDIGTIIYG